MIMSIQCFSVTDCEAIALQAKSKLSAAKILNSNHERNLGILIGAGGGLFLDALVSFQDWGFFTILGYTLGQLGILSSGHPPLVGNNRR